MTPSYQARTAETVSREVEGLFRRYGKERIGFLTCTYKRPVVCSWEAQRRWHSFGLKVAKRLSPMVTVWERHESEGIHWHSVVVCPGDILTGTDLERIKPAVWSPEGANPLLKELWRWIGERKAKSWDGDWGFCWLKPVYGDAASASRYLAGYLGKQGECSNMPSRRWCQECPNIKRVKRVRFSGFRESVELPNREQGRVVSIERVRISTRKTSSACGWSWAGGKGAKFRETMRKFARKNNTDEREVRELYGNKWAYRLRGYLRENIEGEPVLDWVKAKLRHDRQRSETEYIEGWDGSKDGVRWCDVETVGAAPVGTAAQRRLSRRGQVARRLADCVKVAGTVFSGKDGRHYVLRRSKRNEYLQWLRALRSCPSLSAVISKCHSSGWCDVIAPGGHLDSTALTGRAIARPVSPNGGGQAGNVANECEAGGKGSAPQGQPLAPANILAF